LMVVPAFVRVVEKFNISAYGENWFHLQSRPTVVDMQLGSRRKNFCSKNFGKTA